MQKTKSILGIVLLGATLFLTSCSGKVKGDEAKVADAQETQNTSGTALAADLTTSSVGFTGIGVGKTHPGIFKLKEGSLNVADGKISGGKFVIDIPSLQMEQKEEFIGAKLLPHLLSPDFFDATKFPTANFEITKIEPYTETKSDSSVVEGANYLISGNLTLKDVTKNISFPAKVDVTENSANAIANFNMDRTQWKLSYGNDKSLKDKFISETVNVKLNIAANNNSLSSK